MKECKWTGDGMISKLVNKIQYVVQKIFNFFYERKLQKRLKNDNFTILCSNCIGGVIYHRLNKKFLSPTINLWMHQPDFLKFVMNLDKYIPQKLEFIKTDYKYPVGRLGDIRIYFNHSKSEAEARENWDRRKERIHYDNLYIIMYDRDGITKDDILSLNQVTCKNKIVFSEKEYKDIDYVMTIKPTSKLFGEQYLDKDWLGMRSFEKHFDFVNWLNA